MSKEIPIQPQSFQVAPEQQEVQATRVIVTDVRMDCSVQKVDDKGNVLESRRVSIKNEGDTFLNDDGFLAAVLKNAGIAADAEAPENAGIVSAGG